MGQTFASMLRRWETLNPVALIASAARQELDYAADLNQEQLFAGFKNDGDRLKPYRNPAYAAKKNRRNPAPGLGNPDAYATGELYRRLRATIEGKRAIIFQSDSKSAVFMEERDGPAIFGFTKDSRGQFVVRIRPGVIQGIRDATGCR
jgi:hypothetical protein